MRFDSPSADRLTAVAFFALGSAMAWGGFVMDRLEIRHIHPASIPGLVPMVLGGALMICAVLLATGADKTPREDGASEEDTSWSDFAFTALWSCVFAVGLVSRIPFALASALYIAGFAGWFLVPAAGPGSRRAKTLIFVVLFGGVTAAAIAALFRYGFLVRLP